MANGWSIIIGLVVVVLACLAAWVLSPKGETQTYALSAALIVRESLLIALQNLAKLIDPLVRKLLPNVGHYIPRAMAPSYRSSTKRLEI
ncbi:hypothetical protein LSUE1_G000738 [Lachnellula suecica]|uniref:Uncharacterized protein n=1 Tax=Lachnellula suecica TaxID=602035 RepID=A0A8T9CDW4_9HELO|nr:hypothetical protein LSUE1_G000738 [Lachnellula suecica]